MYLQRLCLGVLSKMQILIQNLLQVGASNELPESEELDALYDRFLIRRQVAQVSDVGLPAMLAAAADNSLAVRVCFNACIFEAVQHTS